MKIRTPIALLFFVIMICGVHGSNVDSPLDLAHHLPADFQLIVAVDISRILRDPIFEVEFLDSIRSELESRNFPPLFDRCGKFPDILAGFSANRCSPLGPAFMLVIDTDLEASEFKAIVAGHGLEPLGKPETPALYALPADTYVQYSEGTLVISNKIRIFEIMNENPKGFSRFKNSRYFWEMLQKDRFKSKPASWLIRPSSWCVGDMDSRAGVGAASYTNGKLRFRTEWHFGTMELADAAYPLIVNFLRELRIFGSVAELGFLSDLEKGDVKRFASTVVLDIDVSPHEIESIKSTVRRNIAAASSKDAEVE